MSFLHQGSLLSKPRCRPFPDASALSDCVVCPSCSPRRAVSPGSVPPPLLLCSAAISPGFPPFRSVCSAGQLLGSLWVLRLLTLLSVLWFSECPTSKEMLLSEAELFSPAVSRLSMSMLAVWVSGSVFCLSSVSCVFCPLSFSAGASSLLAGRCLMHDISTLMIW